MVRLRLRGMRGGASTTRGRSPGMEGEATGMMVWRGGEGTRLL